MHNLTVDDVKAPVDRAEWCALWTHAHCEQLVQDQLKAKQFDVFLPMTTMWSRRGGLQHQIQVPMFPGYLFLRQTINKANCIEILKTRGLSRILGERWDRPALVADSEIEAVQRLLETRLPVVAHPYLQEGQRVRIVEGPLADLEGILVEAKPSKGLFVLSVNLLRRSVAVEIDCTRVVPANPPRRIDDAPWALAH
jgi:transcription antitermination factor NusG